MITTNFTGAHWQVCVVKITEICHEMARLFNRCHGPKRGSWEWVRCSDIIPLIVHWNRGEEQTLG